MDPPQHLISDIITLFRALANEILNKIYYTKRYKHTFKISAQDYILLNSNFILSIELNLCFFLCQVMTALAKPRYFDCYELVSLQLYILRLQFLASSTLSLSVADHRPLFWGSGWDCAKALVVHFQGP